MGTGPIPGISSQSGLPLQANGLDTDSDKVIATHRDMG